MKSYAALTLIALSAVSSANFITEFATNPPSTDTAGTFLELQGRANSTIAANTFFVAITGGPTASAIGTVSGVVNVSGMTYGSNGLLLITGFTGTPISNRPNGTTSGPDAATTRVNTTFATDPFGNDAGTFVLVQGGTWTVGTDLDTDNNGTLDNALSGVTVLDGVSFLADGDSQPFQGDYGDDFGVTQLGYFGGALGWEPDYVYRILNDDRNAPRGGTRNGWAGGDLPGGAVALGPYSWDTANDEVAGFSTYGFNNPNDLALGLQVSPGHVNGPVPEPTTLIALGAGALALARRRRSK